MTSPHLSPAIVEHFAVQMDVAGRAALKRAQAAMSAIYREGGHSRNAVPDATTALAYAIARMPATYAACTRAFDLVAAQAPSFTPRSMLDLGAGPGTATLAAAAVWPGLETARLLEPNAALSSLAAAAIPAATAMSCTIEGGDLTGRRAAWPAADLTTLSYVLAEQPLVKIAAIVAPIAALVSGLIVIVEPGTPAGYARILAAREALLTAGLHIVAPCPHADRCPLPTGDWCHFSIRLQRSAGHRHLKDADVPFEDERFSFVSAMRDPLARPATARLIRPAKVEKGFADLALCTATGLETRRIARRDASAYKAVKGMTWGDAV